MASGETWTSQNDITPNTLHIPVFKSFYSVKYFKSKIYHQTLSINNKIYYFYHDSKNQGTYIRDDSSLGTFNYVRGILYIYNSSGVEVEKLTNNHKNEIDTFIIDHF